MQLGTLLWKYNLKDGKSAERWVRLVDKRVMWGDAKGKKVESTLSLNDATALLHGAKSSAFFKQRVYDNIMRD